MQLINYTDNGTPSSLLGNRWFETACRAAKPEYSLSGALRETFLTCREEIIFEDQCSGGPTELGT